jgi:hypothetical protein
MAHDVELRGRGARPDESTSHLALKNIGQVQAFFGLYDTNS